MKIVIDIPDAQYEYLAKIVITGEEPLGYFERVIMRGTPLPKHHGRIIDESQIKHIMCHTEQELYGDKIRYVKVTDAPTIIEGSDNE